MKPACVRFLFFMLFPVMSVGAVSAEDVSRKPGEFKKEGLFPAGLPLINFTSDEGIGYGLKLSIFNNGCADDPYFRETPYFENYNLLFFRTMGGSTTALLETDMVRFAGSPFRIKAMGMWQESLNASYYGVGPEQTRRLTDRNGIRYRTQREYRRRFLLADPRNYKYDKYSVTSPEGRIDLYFDAFDSIRLRLGAGVRRTEIRPWGGRRFDINESGTRAEDVVSLPTRLEEDGRDGEEGWINSAVMGIGYDSRSHEIDPREGILAEYTLRAAAASFGSDYSFIRHTASLRVFATVYNRLTAALRAAYTSISREAPFNELNSFYFLMESQYGLGNNRTLRGYHSDRFTGYTMTCGNLELRARAFSITVFGQMIELLPVAFLDAGSVFDHPADPIRVLDNYRFGYGGGFAIVWNRAFVIHTYYGISSEDRSMSVDFSHAF